MADARKAGKPTLQQPHGGKEIEREGLFRQLRDQSICRLPIRTGHRMISFRLQVGNDGFGERVQGDIAGKELFEDGAEHKHALPVECGFVEDQGDFQAARKGDRAWGLDSARQSAGSERSRRPSICLSMPVVRVGVEPEHVPQPLSPQFGAGIHQGEVIQREMADEAPGKPA